MNTGLKRYVCVCMCIYTRMYIHILMHTRAYVYVRMHACIQVYTHSHTYALHFEFCNHASPDVRARVPLEARACTYFIRY